MLVVIFANSSMNFITMSLVIGNKIVSFDHVIDNLYIGDIESAYSAEVDIIINASNEKYSTPKKSFYVDIEDEPDVCISEFFCLVIKDNIDRNPDKKILVHCQCGVSRSATLVLSYLMTRSMNLSQSVTFLKSKRAFQYTRPNRGFFRQLIAYELTLLNSNSVTESDYRRIF